MERRESNQDKIKHSPTLSLEFIAPWFDVNPSPRRNNDGKPRRQRGGEKAIKTRPNTVQLSAGIHLIARFTQDESETRRNNECQRPDDREEGRKAIKVKH